MFRKIARNIEKGAQKLLGTHPRFNPHYSADGFGVYGKNTGFLDEKRFAAAWEAVRAFNAPYWPGVPDVRWRAHICVWAAHHALRREGDFVELGVNTGILSSMICKATDFAREKDRKFYLFDTFTGIPGAGASAHEAENIARLNAAHFERDVHAVATEAFRDVPSARLVRGTLPGSLAEVSIERIAYLSIDLNSAAPEIASAEALWPKLAPGAIVVLDDYAFEGHEEQYEAWNAFCRARGLMVLTVPTGQGVILIP